MQPVCIQQCAVCTTKALQNKKVGSSSTSHSHSFHASSRERWLILDKQLTPELILLATDLAKSLVLHPSQLASSCSPHLSSCALRLAWSLLLKTPSTACSRCQQAPEALSSPLPILLDSCYRWISHGHAGSPHAEETLAS